MIIPIGSDHAGFETKQILITYLTSLGYEVKDYGCYSDQSIDYPDYAHPVATHVESNPGSIGILLCGWVGRDLAAIVMMARWYGHYVRNESHDHIMLNCKHMVSWCNGQHFGP